MSKFFNETRKVFEPASGWPKLIAAKIESPQRADEVDVKVEESTKSETVVSDSHTAEAVLDHAGGNEMAWSVAARRLKDCRQIRLPRDNKKSFLAREYGTDLQAAVEAYRTLRTRLLSRQSQRGLRSLAVSGTAQGEGKTLTALNLALCYSHLRDRSTLLVDGDLRTKGLSNLLELHQLPGLGDILESGRSYQSVLLRTEFSNLCLLPAGTSTVPSPELFSLARWKEFLAWSRETFDTVLIDSPPILELADTELILSACDGMLMVMRAGTTKCSALAKVLDQVDTRKLVGIVLNGYNDPEARTYRGYRYGDARSNHSARQS
jgi:capsular exopolysaccharide synthesis family protein